MGDGNLEGFALTLLVDFPLEACFDGCVAERMLAYELEVFGGSVHLGALHVGYDDVNVVAAVIVHASQKHEFG